jgi:hypothetical protein
MRQRDPDQVSASGYARRLERVRHAAVDPVLDSLTPREREGAAAAWCYRAGAEHAASLAFRRIAEELAEDGCPDELVAMARRAEADERYHAELCAFVAERYLGQPAAPEPPRDYALEFASCDATVGRVLRVTLVAAVGESLSTAYLLACLRAAQGTLARAALRELSQDEVSHARIGWARLATLPRVMRARVADELPTLIASAVASWEHEVIGLPCPPGHGALDLAATRRVIQQALDEVVIPGLRSLETLRE